MELRQCTRPKPKQKRQPKLEARYGGGGRRWSKTKRGPGRSLKDTRHNHHRKRMLRIARRRGQVQ